MGQSHSNVTTEGLEKVLEKAIQTKNIKQFVSLLSKIDEYSWVQKKTLKQVLGLHDPVFLTKLLKSGYNVSFSDLYGNAYHLLLSTVTPKTPISTILELMNILKENNVNISYSTTHVLSPLQYVEYGMRKDIPKSEILNFIQTEMRAKGETPDMSLPYERMPIRLLADKYAHEIPALSYMNEKKWRGTLCDSLGFFQHYGECWNDAIQMAVLYTDGIKELTQPLLYFTKITHEYISSLEPFKYESDSFIDTAFVYMQSLQRRFRRHYNLEVSRRNTVRNIYGTNDVFAKAVCSPQFVQDSLTIVNAMSLLYEFGTMITNAEKAGVKLPANRIDLYRKGQDAITTQKNILRSKYRHNVLKTLEESGKSYQAMNALQGAVAGKELYMRDKEMYTNPNIFLESYKTYPGGHAEFFLKYALQLCGFSVLENAIPANYSLGIGMEEVIIKNTLNASQSVLFQIGKKNKAIRKTADVHTVIRKSTNAICMTIKQSDMLTGHQALFYQCGGKQFYYEDNTGPVPFAWKSFFQPQTWAPLFPDMTEQDYWADVEMHVCSLAVQYDTGQYIHSHYPILKFKNASPVHSSAFFTVSPTTGGILIPNAAPASDENDLKAYITNDANIILTRTNDNNVPTYTLTCLHIPENAKIEPNSAENIPFIPSAIRTRPKTRRGNASMRRATRRAGSSMRR